MSNIARLVFLSIAVLVAFAVSYMVYNRITNPTVVVDRSGGPPTAEIAVAARDMGRGDKIAAEDVRMVGYLKESLPRGHFTTREEAVGRIVVSSIAATEPVLESALAPKGLTKGGMAAIIKPQKRAMAVKVDNVIGVAGFLHPGHMVDVLVSIDRPGDKTRAKVTKTVLENIPVLSVGTQAQESEDKQAQKVTVVTLEVSLEEGEKLALAVNEGQIQLALRGYRDLEPVLTMGTTTESLMRSYSPEVYEPVEAVVEDSTEQPMLKPAKPQLIVRVMNGSKVNKVAVNR